MTNLEKIKKAWDMGWSATVEFCCEKHPIIGVPTVEYLDVISTEFTNLIALRRVDGTIIHWEEETAEKHKIIGYKYAGELAGNEPISKGQIFKIKGTDMRFRYVGHEDGRIQIGRQLYKPSEIEPYFD